MDGLVFSFFQTELIWKAFFDVTRYYDMQSTAEASAPRGNNMSSGITYNKNAILLSVHHYCSSFELVSIFAYMYLCR